jgi:hypothetical protein
MGAESVSSFTASSGAKLKSTTGADSSRDAAASDETRTASNDRGWSAQGTIYTFGFWLSIMFVMLATLAAIIWIVVRLVRKDEAADDSSDLVYTNLQDARHIYARIIK